jgi:hypothetical protein
MPKLENPAVPPWARALAKLLDSAFTIPGTNVKVGLDAVLGFLAPGAGDAAAALAAAVMLWLGFRLRVPKVILGRMLLNIVIDAVVGAVPALGDLFDLYFRAAERNLALLERHAGDAPAKPGAGDYALVGLAFLVVLSLLALPVLVGIVLIHWVARATAG